MTIWRVDDALPYLCSLMRHSVSQNIVLMLSIRRTTLSFFFRLFSCGQIQEQLSGLMFINNKINHIFHTTWGVFKHMLYLCMFAKVFHGFLFGYIYVWDILVVTEFGDNNSYFSNWLNDFILRIYLTLKLSVQHSNFNDVNVLTTMQQYSRGHKTRYILEYEWIF